MIVRYLLRIIRLKMQTARDKIAVNTVSVTFHFQFALSCFEISVLSL